MLHGIASTVQYHDSIGGYHGLNNHIFCFICVQIMINFHNAVCCANCFYKKTKKLAESSNTID